MTVATPTIIAKFYVDQGIASLGLTVDKEAHRYALEGIAVQQYTGQDGSKYVRFMSTDGRRATHVSYPHEPGWCFATENGEPVILKAGAVTYLSAAERKSITSAPHYARTSSIWVRLTVHNDGTVLRECGFNDKVVVSVSSSGNLVEGRYPRIPDVFYSKQVPDFAYVCVDAEYLIDACKQVLAMNQASDPTNKTPNKGIVLAIDRSNMKDNGDATSIFSQKGLRVVSDGLNRNMCSMIMQLQAEDAKKKEVPLEDFAKSEFYAFAERIAKNPTIHSTEMKNMAKKAKKPKTAKPEPATEPEPTIDPPATISTAPPEVASPAPEVFPDGYLYTDAPEEFDNPGTSTVRVVGCSDLNPSKLVRLVKIENASDARWLGQIERYEFRSGNPHFVADTEEKFATMTRPNGVWKLAEELAVA